MNIQNTQNWTNSTPAQSADFHSRTPSLKIALRVLDNGLIVVKSCELTGGVYHHRSSFRAPDTPLSVFRDEISDVLRDFMGQARGNTQIMAVPDFSLEIPGLTLLGAQIIVGTSQEGEVSATIVFKSVLGGVDAVLKDQALHDVTTSRRKVFETDVMLDIAQPILDMFSNFDVEPSQASPSQVQEMLQAVIENTHELQFRAELLKRFINKDGPQSNRPRRRPPLFDSLAT
jgi:hypothetical protein